MPSQCGTTPAREIICLIPVYRRFLVHFVRRGFIALLLLCLGCTAQSVDQDVTRLVERQVRAYYNIPAEKLSLKT